MTKHNFTFSFFKQNEEAAKALRVTILNPVRQEEVSLLFFIKIIFSLFFFNSAGKIIEKQKRHHLKK